MLLEPGSIWPGGDHSAIYADDFGSSAQIDSNVFMVGHGMHLLFFLNMGRDFSFTRNIIAPINASLQRVVSPNGPVAQVHNKGCGGATDTACDACFNAANAPGWRHGNVWLQLLFDMPFNSSAVWKRTFPKLASLWSDKPCQASGSLIADNVVCYPPPMVAGFVTCEGKCMGNTIVDKLAAFGTVARNNTFVEAVCSKLR